jgi:hypothetical protein
MTTLNLILSSGSALLQVALVVLVSIRKLHGSFKFFFAYLVCSIVGVVVRLSVMSNPQQFYLIYWIVEAVYSVLTVSVIVEIFGPAVEAVHDQFGWAVFLVPIGILALAYYLFWRPIHRIFGSGVGQVAANISAFELGVSCIAVIVCLFALWLEKRSEMWGQYALGVLCGFGFIGLGTLLAYAGRLWLPFGDKAKMIFGYVPSFAFFGAVLIWFVVFLEKEEPEAPQKPIDREKMKEALDSLNEVFRDWRRKARRFRLRFWSWRLRNQRPGMTS